MAEIKREGTVVTIHDAHWDNYAEISWLGPAVAIEVGAWSSWTKDTERECFTLEAEEAAEFLRASADMIELRMRK